MPLIKPSRTPLKGDPKGLASLANPLWID